MDEPVIDAPAGMEQLDSLLAEADRRAEGMSEADARVVRRYCRTRLEERALLEACQEAAAPLREAAVAARKALTAMIVAHIPAGKSEVFFSVIPRDPALPAHVGAEPGSKTANIDPEMLREVIRSVRPDELQAERERMRKSKRVGAKRATLSLAFLRLVFGRLSAARHRPGETKLCLLKELPGDLIEAPRAPAEMVEALRTAVFSRAALETELARTSAERAEMRSAIKELEPQVLEIFARYDNPKQRVASADRTVFSVSTRVCESIPKIKVEDIKLLFGKLLESLPADDESAWNEDTIGSIASMISEAMRARPPESKARVRLQRVPAKRPREPAASSSSD